MLNFIKDKSLHGFFSYKSLKIKPRIGDLIKIRVEPIGNEGFYRVLTLKKADPSNQKECKAYKEVSGKIGIPLGKKFGFLDDVFISPDIIEKQNIKDQDELTCKTILSFNKKKNAWGWKCYEVKK